jgi:hypothetical protein
MSERDIEVTEELLAKVDQPGDEWVTIDECRALVREIRRLRVIRKAMAGEMERLRAEAMADPQRVAETALEDNQRLLRAELAKMAGVLECLVFAPEVHAHPNVTNRALALIAKWLPKQEVSDE